MKKLVVFLLLLASTAGAGYGLYFVWRSSPRTAEAFTRSGREFYAQSRYPEATIQFLNALQLDSRHRDARYFLSLSHIQQQQWTSALRELKNLLDYYPDDADAKLRLGSLYLAAALGDKKFFTMAREVADQVLAKNPSSVEALVLAGNAAAGLLDLRSSVESLERALRLDPENVSAYIMLGTYQVYQQKLPDAEKAFLKAREIDPKSKNALVSLANYYRATGNLSMAERTLDEALAMYPSDRDVYLPAIGFYAQTGRSEVAERLLKSAQDKAPEDPGPSLVLVDLYLRQARTNEVRDLLTSLKTRFPDSIAVSKKCALVMVRTDPAWTRREVDQILRAHPHDPEGYILLGELQFFGGDLDAAEGTFKHDVLRETRYSEPRFFLGAVAARRGQADLEQAEYQAAVERNANYIPARLGLADVFLRRGRLTDAREEVRKLLALDSKLPAARLLKATLDTVEKEYGAAEKELTALAEEQPSNPVIQLAMARHYEARGLFPRATDHFERAHKLDPRSGECLTELVRSYLRDNAVDKALRLIDSAVELDSAALRHELKGHALVQAGKLTDAEKSYREAVRSDAKRVSAFLSLKDLYLAGSRGDEALSVLHELLKSNPDYAPAHAIMASMHRQGGNLKLAKESYSRALELDPKMSAAANNLAYLLADQDQDLDSALKWARAARRLDPENPSYADTLGWIYFKRGEYVLALDQLRFGADRAPESATNRYHLAMAHWKRKQLAEARAEFKRALSNSREFKERALAEAALSEIAKEMKQN